jgi:hypothetical protein
MERNVTSSVAVSAHHLVIKHQAFVMVNVKRDIMGTFVKYPAVPFARMIRAIRSPGPAVRGVRWDIMELTVTRPVVHVMILGATTVQGRA